MSHNPAAWGQKREDRTQKREKIERKGEEREDRKIVRSGSWEG